MGKAVLEAAKTAKTANSHSYALVRSNGPSVCLAKQLRCVNRCNHGATRRPNAEEIKDAKDAKGAKAHSHALV